MCIFDSDLSHEDAKFIEVEIISLCDEYPITNLTDGGDGTSGHKLSKETRDKIRAKATGRSLSHETREKLRDINLGRVSPNKGITFSVARRQKISDGLRLRYENPAERDRLREIMFARYADDSERQRTAIANRKLGPNKRNKSGYKGVSYHYRTGKWVAQIKIGKQTCLGRFPTPEEAARAYDRAAFEAWGSDCYLNFPADFEMAA